MNTGKFTSHAHGNALGLAVTVVVTLIGICVIAGWHFHIRPLVQIIPGVISMQYNTALCFVGLGVSALLLIARRGHKSLPAIGGTFVAVMGALVIFQYMTGISLGIDTAFFYPWERTLSAYPGRMALTSAMSFTLAGSALCLLTIRPQRLAAFVIAHTLPLSFGLTSLIGYLLGITYVLPFRLGSQMAVHTAFAFTIYGGAMIFYAWQRAPQTQDGLPRWSPAIAAVMMPVLFVGFSSAVQTDSVIARGGQLVFALAGAALLGFAVHKLKQSRIFYKGLILISIPLVFVLTFVVLVSQLKRSGEQAQAFSLHSQDVIARTHALSESLIEAQSSIRGYVITGDPAYAEPYHRAVRQIPEEINQLQALLRGKPERQAKAYRLGEKATERMALLAEIERLMSANRRDEAMARVSSGAGERLMGEFRRETEPFLAEEERLSAMRREQLRESWQRFDWLLAAGAAAVLLLAFTLALLFSRGISRRLLTLSENARALAKGQELAAPQTGTDEIAHLDRVFHQMAGSLHKAQDELERRVEQRTAELVEANRLLKDEIGERERTQQSLEESEMRFHSAFDYAPIGIGLASTEGRWLQVNNSFCEIVGYAKEELLASDFQSITHPDDLAAYFEQQRRMLAGEVKTCQIEKRYIHKLGHEVWATTSVSLVRDIHNNPIYFISQIQDITERRNAEEALKASEEQLRQSQKLEGIGQLAGGIAHDFNNLLTAINGYSELTLRRLAPDDSLHRNVSEIKKAGERAAGLTRQLLAFSRKQILQPQVLDLNNCVTDMDKMLRRLIGEDINILTILDPDLSRVKADAGQLEQVIMNLAVNARDAMPEGGKLTIKTANVELSEDYTRRHAAVEPGSYVMLAVSDTGSGMDSATQRQIFEPFFTTKEVGKGTGLGLATVYGIVKQSGGNIWVYSEPGHGTTFKIYLPCVAEALDSVETSELRVAAPQSTETILLVEDEEAVRELLREVLEAEGYTVLATCGGAEALEVCGNHKNTIQLMLTDVVMPQMSGRVLAERATSLRPEMKVLYMSGYTDEAIVHHGVLAAGVAFLEKPFTPDSVARKVRETIDETQTNCERSVGQTDAQEWEEVIG